MKKIIHSVHIKAPVERVFEALTTQEGLAGWWSAEVTVEPGLGGLVDFRFLEGFNPDMEVSELEENRRVGWKCVGGHDNWADNTFSFELGGTDGATSLMFVQNYAQELSDEVYGTYNYNWGYYMQSLKKLCKTGTGNSRRPGVG